MSYFPSTYNTIHQRSQQCECKYRGIDVNHISVDTEKDGGGLLCVLATRMTSINRRNLDSRCHLWLFWSTTYCCRFALSGVTKSRADWMLFILHQDPRWPIHQALLPMGGPGPFYFRRSELAYLLALPPQAMTLLLLLRTLASFRCPLSLTPLFSISPCLLGI